jgi:hypothetical protein
MATRQAVGDIRQGHVLAPCLCGLASWSRRAAVPLRCLSHLLPRRADSIVTSPSYLRRIASHSRLEVVGNTTGQRGYLTWIYPNKSLNSSLSRIPRRALANGRCARPYLTVPAFVPFGGSLCHRPARHKILVVSCETATMSCHGHRTSSTCRSLV